MFTCQLLNFDIIDLMRKSGQSPFFDIFEKETRRFINHLFFERKKKKVKLVGIIVFVPIIILLSTFLVKANISYFYSPLCLGNWVNVQNIQGEPQLTSNSDVSEFSNSNSAVLKNNSGEIFCGKFESADVPDSLDKVYLRLSLAIVSNKLKEIPAVNFENGQTLDISDEGGVIFIVPKNKILETETPIPEIKNENQDENKTINELKGLILPKPELSENLQPSSLPEESLLPVESSGSVPNLPPEPTPEPSSEPSPEPSIEQTPIISPESFLDKVKTLVKISKAFAQEPLDLNLDDLLEVRYTKDGENWYILGRVNRNNQQNISFELPINSLEELKNIQIAVSSLPTLDSDTTIYLESIWIEVEYSPPVVEFVKDIGEAVVETLTLQNLIQELAPPTPSPVVWVKKTVHSFSIIDFDSALSLGDDDQQVEINSDCKDKYYVIALYRNKDDFNENPSSALYNSAFLCQSRSFKHVLSELPENIEPGIYYLVIGKEGDKGSWIPESEPRRIKIDKKQIEVIQ